MRRLPLILSTLALLVALAGPVAAKVANVTNPMQADLDGGAFNIGNVGTYNGLDAHLSTVHAQQAYASEAILGQTSISGYPGFLTLADGAGAFVNVRGGTESPVGIGTPGVYVQHTGAGTAALWVKTSAAADGWTCVAGCGS